MDRELTHTIGGCIAQATQGAWSLEAVDVQAGGLLLRLHSAEGAFALEVRRAEPGRRCFRALGDLAYSYRSGTVTPSSALVDRAVGALHGVLSEARYTVPDTAPAEARSPVASAVRQTQPLFPTPYHCDHLERTIDVPGDLREAFRRDGHVLVRGALDGGVLLAAREVIVAALGEALQGQFAQQAVPVAERKDAYSRSFTQITNLGLDNAAIRVLTQSRRIAKMAADLMGVRGVRIFCEDWLIKEVGAGITPWHQDAAVMPVDTAATITVWIPFQPVKEGTGLMRFARGSHHAGVQPIETINDESEDRFDEIIRRHGWTIDVSPPMLVGDVSFHDGSTIHGAFPNDSDAPRIALALHCFADGAVLREATTPAMQNMRDIYAAGLATGTPAASPFWPLTFRDDEPAIGRSPVSVTSRALHLKATLVPGGTAPVDLWVQDGRIRFTPIAGAETVAPEGGFLSSGLVDCHTHLSWPHTPQMQAETQTVAFMNANRAAYAADGVLALRDMGSASDHVAALGDEPGLPRVRAAGMLVVPYDGFPFTPVAPTALARTFVDRLERGASWIKVFSDWSTDWGGQMHTGFSETNAVTYPLDVLREAVAAVHHLGGLVAAHCFTRAGAEVAIRAGVDSLEHGWGVDRPLIDEMAERGIAWIPLVGIASVMWRDAMRDQQPDHAAWIDRSMATLAQTVPYAHRAGVRILAGTDWFPEVTVADEIRALCALGVDTASAVGAGAWEARRWLGEPGIEEGAPADLVVYSADPRTHVDTLDGPTLILIGGKRVSPAQPRAQRHYLPWSARHRIAPA
jgi:imidazolonepropionase-like amidohydrolase/ectoine hydroxylase-related dioxygenase (phytanoyl-CoA dioxygenase family)